MGAQWWWSTSEASSPTPLKSSWHFSSVIAPVRPGASSVIASVAPPPYQRGSSRVAPSASLRVPLSTCQTSTKHLSSRVNCFNTTSVMITVPSSLCQTSIYRWGGGWTSCFNNTMSVSVTMPMSSCQTSTEHWTSWVTCFNLTATRSEFYLLSLKCKLCGIVYSSMGGHVTLLLCDINIYAHCIPHKITCYLTKKEH